MLVKPCGRHHLLNESLVQEALRPVYFRRALKQGLGAWLTFHAAVQETLLNRMRLNGRQQDAIRLWPYLAFITCALVAVGWSALQRSPSGIHFVRQTDSLAFADQYYFFGQGFFEPAVYNLSSEGGRAACEFPLLYYLTALLYRVFGYDDSILRVITFLLVVAGMLSFIRLGIALTGNRLLSFLSVVLVSGSCILYYYASNVLPDGAALGLTLLALGIGLHPHVTRAGLWLTYLLFLFACLIKITYLIYPAALAAYPLLRGTALDGRSSGNRFVHLAGIAVVGTAVCVWTIYVHSYNGLYGDRYFLTTWAPVWNMSAAECKDVWLYLTDYWSGAFFKPSSFVALALSLALVFFWFRRLLPGHGTFLLVASAGCAAFMLFFLQKFKDHDYYLLVTIPLAATALLLLVGLIARKPDSRAIRWLTVAALTVLSFTGNQYAQQKMTNRLALRENLFSTPVERLAGQDAALHALGCLPNHTVVVVGDYTRNGSLFHLKRKGITFSPERAGEASQFLHTSHEWFDFVLVRDSLEVSLPAVFHPAGAIGNYRVFALH